MLLKPARTSSDIAVLSCRLCANESDEELELELVREGASLVECAGGELGLCEWLLEVLVEVEVMEASCVDVVEELDEIGRAHV